MRFLTSFGMTGYVSGKKRGEMAGEARHFSSLTTKPIVIPSAARNLNNYELRIEACDHVIDKQYYMSINLTAMPKKESSKVNIF